MATADKRELSKGFNSSSGSFELVLSPILMALVGFWLDGRIGTGPWLTVVGAVFGLAGALVKTYYTYQAKMAVHTAESRAAREADSESAARPALEATA